MLQIRAQCCYQSVAEKIEELQCRVSERLKLRVGVRVSARRGHLYIKNVKISMLMLVLQKSMLI